MSAEDDMTAARTRFAEFRKGRTDERMFTHPIPHPSHTTGFCFCEQSALKVILFLARAALMRLIFSLPFSRPKVWLLRRLGARVGQNVFISAGACIDLNYPELVTLEDDAYVGMNAHIMTHEFRMTEFRAGKVIVRRGALIGGFAIVGCGVEVGEGATVAGGSVVRRDIPAGATAIGNPARVVRPGLPGQEAGARHD